MATQSSILTWRIPWTEDTIHGIAELDMTEQLAQHSRESRQTGEELRLGVSLESQLSRSYK